MVSSQGNVFVFFVFLYFCICIFTVQHSVEGEWCLLKERIPVISGCGIPLVLNTSIQKPDMELRSVKLFPHFHTL